MAGTKAGGAKAAATNKAKYGRDFYARIGSMGGKLGRTGGFYANRELARKAGRIGGLKSRRASRELRDGGARVRERELVRTGGDEAIADARQFALREGGPAAA